MPAYKKKGFVIGLVLFFAMIISPAPAGLSVIGWSVAAVAISNSYRYCSYN